MFCVLKETKSQVIKQNKKGADDLSSAPFQQLSSSKIIYRPKLQRPEEFFLR